MKHVIILAVVLKWLMTDKKLSGFNLQEKKSTKEICSLACSTTYVLKPPKLDFKARFVLRKKKISKKGSFK